MSHVCWREDEEKTTHKQTHKTKQSKLGCKNELILTSQTSYTNLNVHAATQPRMTQSMRLGNQLGLVVLTLQKIDCLDAYICWYYLDDDFYRASTLKSTTSTLGLNSTQNIMGCSAQGSCPSLHARMPGVRRWRRREWGPWRAAWSWPRRGTAQWTRSRSRSGGGRAWRTDDENIPTLNWLFMINSSWLPDNSVDDDPSDEEGAHELVLNHSESVLQAVIRLQHAVTEMLLWVKRAQREKFFPPPRGPVRSNRLTILHCFQGEISNKAPFPWEELRPCITNILRPLASRVGICK